MQSRFMFSLCLLLSFQTLRAEPVSVQALAETWTFHGAGVGRVQNRMFYMAEAAESAGVMLVSPEAYEGDVVLRYEVMPLNAASVCVVILSASDGGQGTALTLPADYDGGMGVWTQGIHNYFFAFHNAAHDRTPFAVRYPGSAAIGEHPENVVRSGEFSRIEIGRRGDTLWMSVNGKRLFEGTDPNPLPGGHIALRLRGIAGMPAAALLRNVTLEHK